MAGTAIKWWFLSFKKIIIFQTVQSLCPLIKCSNLCGLNLFVFNNIHYLRSSNHLTAYLKPLRNIVMSLWIQLLLKCSTHFFPYSRPLCISSNFFNYHILCNDTTDINNYHYLPQTYCKSLKFSITLQSWFFWQRLICTPLFCNFTVLSYKMYLEIYFANCTLSEN